MPANRPYLADELEFAAEDLEFTDAPAATSPLTQMRINPKTGLPFRMDTGSPVRDILRTAAIPGQALQSAAESIAEAGGRLEFPRLGVAAAAVPAVAGMALPQSEIEAGIMAASGPVGKVAGAVTGKVASAVGPRLSAAATELMALAEKYGIQLSPADITKSEALARFESLLEKTPFGGERISQFRKSAWNKVKELADSVSERMGTSATKAEVGEVVSRARRELAREAGDVSDQAWAKYEGMLAPDTEMGAVNTLNQAEKLLERELRKSPRLRNQSLISELEWVKSQIRSGQDLGGGKISPATRFKDMAEIRSRIGGLIGALGGGGAARTSGERFVATQEEAAYRRLFGAVARDQESFANAGGSVLKEVYDEAINLFKLSKGTFDNKVLRTVRRLGDENPERIVGLIAKPNNVTNIKRVKSALGPKGMESIQRRFVQDLIESAGETEAKEAFANPSAFVRALKKFDEPTLKALLPEETVSALQGLSRLSQNIGVAEKIAGNPSGTGKAVIAAGSAIPAIFAALTPGGIEGRIIGGTIGTGITLLTPRLMADAYLSKAGRSLLVQGYRIPANSPEAAKWATRVSTFLAAKGLGAKETSNGPR